MRAKIKISLGDLMLLDHMSAPVILVIQEMDLPVHWKMQMVMDFQLM